MRMIGKHWIGLIVCVIASLIGGPIYTFRLEKSVWTSTGSVIILADNNTSSDDTTTDSSFNGSNLNLSLALVPSIVDFMNAGDVITDTATSINTKYSSSYTYDPMNKTVRVTSRTYTSIEKSLFIDFSGSSSSKDLSQDIANAVIDNAIFLSNFSPSTNVTETVVVSAMVVSSFHKALITTLPFLFRLIHHCHQSKQSSYPKKKRELPCSLPEEKKQMKEYTLHSKSYHIVKTSHLK